MRLIKTLRHENYLISKLSTIYTSLLYKCLMTFTVRWKWSDNIKIKGQDLSQSITNRMNTKCHQNMNNRLPKHKLQITLARFVKNYAHVRQLTNTPFKWKGKHFLSLELRFSTSFTFLSMLLLNFKSEIQHIISSIILM